MLRRCAPLLLVVLGVLSACAPSTPSGSFNFVSPGGKTDIFYDPPSSRGVITGMAGPELLSDAPISLADFPGQVVVINLWGQWCGPCRAESDDLQRVYDATKGYGVQFLGINVRDPQRDQAQDFVLDRGITFPSIYDPPMRTLAAMSASYPTSVIPSTIVLDRQHRVAAVFLRELIDTDLQPVVERIAAESPPPTGGAAEPAPGPPTSTAPGGTP